MNPHLTPEKIDALLLETAGETQRRAWSAHLEACPSCREAFDAQAALFRRIAERSGTPPPPAELGSRISSAIKRTGGFKRPEAASRPPAVARARRWVWSIAAVFLAFLAGVWVGRSPAGERAASLPIPKAGVATEALSDSPERDAPERRNRREDLPHPPSEITSAGGEWRLAVAADEPATQQTLHPNWPTLPALHDRDPQATPRSGSNPGS